MVLQEHYVGGDPLPLRILTTLQMREAMDVRLPAAAVREVEPKRPPWWGIGAAVAGVALVALLIWGLSNFLRSGAEAEGEETPAASQDTGEQASVEGDTATQQSSEQEGDAPAQQSDLPPSRNARSELGIGMRVQIVPGLSLVLRSEPGADAGSEVGYMADGSQAQIVAGPQMTQGDSDTIVWWLVQLDDGTQAWAAANTSQQTLLIPAP
jgi:hypothetical protein